MISSADEKRWRAEEDARVLAEATAISKDKERLNAAAEAAKRIAEEEAARANAMRSVARRGGKVVTSDKEPKRPIGYPSLAIPSIPSPSKTDNKGIATFTLNKVTKK